MAIFFELNEVADAEIKRQIESEFVRCMGDRPAEEHWKVWIHDLQSCHRVVVKGPTQTRDRLFFEDIRETPRAIRNWLESYPIR